METCPASGRGTGSKRPMDEQNGNGNTESGSIVPADNKKIRVDAAGPSKETGDQQSGTNKQNESQRDNVLRYILACHIHLTARFTGKCAISNMVYRDISVSQYVARVFRTVHEWIKVAIECDSRGSMGDEETIYQLRFEGNKIGVIPHDICVQLIKHIAVSFGLGYKKPYSSNDWFETAEDLICVTEMFYIRMRELRKGYDKTTRSEWEPRVNQSISHQGFNPEHLPLLEGITIPLETMARHVKAQTLGPLTSLFCLTNINLEHSCNNHVRSVVEQNMSFLPEVDSLINVCCEEPALKVKQLLTIIADILLITTPEEPKFASFPICMLYLLFDVSEAAHYTRNTTRYIRPTDISWFDFSGNGAFQLYKRASEKSWLCPIYDENSKFLPQILFHRIWGTFGTDFGLLEFMSGHTQWATRNEMDNALKIKYFKKPQETMLIPIHRYKVYSGYKNIARIPNTSFSAFSLFTRETYTLKFIKYVMSRRESDNLIHSVHVLKNIFQQIKDNLLQYGDDVNKIKQKWHRMEGSTETKYGPEIDEEPKNNNQCFIGKWN